MNPDNDKDLLAKAFLEAAEDEFADAPAEEDIDLEFSEEFEQRMNRLIQRNKRRQQKKAGRGQKPEGGNPSPDPLESPAMRELLAKAFLEAAEDEFADVPEEKDIDLEFSPAFEERMNRFIAKRKKGFLGELRSRHPGRYFYRKGGKTSPDPLESPAIRELLAKAFLEEAEDEFADVPEEKDIDLEFSPAFEERMNRFIAKRKKKYFSEFKTHRNKAAHPMDAPVLDLEEARGKAKKSRLSYFNTAGKRVAAVFLASVILFSTSMTVEAIRVPVIHFMTQAYTEFTRFIGISNHNAPDTIETVYTLAGIPEGYEQTNYSVSNNSVYTEWSNNTDQIIFGQAILSNSFKLNTEEFPYENIEIMGLQAVLVYFADNYFLLWNTDDYSFYLSWSNQRDKKAFISLATSVIYLEKVVE